MKVIDIREIKGVQCGIIHITSNSLLRNGYYYVVKHNEVNQQLVFVTGGRRTKRKQKWFAKTFSQPLLTF